MNKIDIELWSDDELISKSSIAGNKFLYEFVSVKDYKFDDYEIIDCEYKTSKNEDKQVIMYVHNENENKYYAIVHEFHEGTWLKKVVEIND